MTKQHLALFCIILLLCSILSSASATAETSLDKIQQYQQQIDEAGTIDQTKENILPNEDANLERIQNLIRNSDYNAAGQLSTREYGNGIETALEYNPVTLRLGRLHSSVQDISYGYDNVGNILSIEDARRGIIKAMRYDDLDRLGYADAVQGIGVLYEYNYGYDYSGNILRVASPERILEYGYTAYEGVPVLHSPARITVSEGETG